MLGKKNNQQQKGQSFQEFRQQKANQPKKPIYKRPWFIVIAGLLVLGAIGNALGGGNTDTQQPTQQVQRESKQDESKEEVSKLFDVRDLKGKSQTEMDTIIGITSETNSDGNFVYKLPNYEIEVHKSDKLGTRVSITPATQKSMKKDADTILESFGFQPKTYTNSDKVEFNTNGYVKNKQAVSSIDIFSDSVKEKSDKINYIYIIL